MMTISLLLDGALTALAATLFFSGKFGITKQMSAAPLVMAVLDAVFASKIQWGLTPVLSALLLGLQLVMLAGGVELLRQDRVHFRQKQDRRIRRRALAQTRLAFELAQERREQSAAGVCA